MCPTPCCENARTHSSLAAEVFRGKSLPVLRTFNRQTCAAAVGRGGVAWRGVAVGPAPLCPAARSALPRASARSAPGSDPAPPAVLARKAVTGRLGEAAVSQPWQTGCFEGCVVTAVLLTLLFQERAIVKILHVILKE